MSCQRTKPCSGCPFSRSVQPSNLGGSSVEVYIGQINLPFWLPCHQSKNYQGKLSSYDETEQCAGAAIMRSNLGMAHRMPDKLLFLPADKDVSFANISQFYQHHTGRTQSEADLTITPGYIAWCMDMEMQTAKEQGTFQLVEK